MYISPLLDIIFTHHLMSTVLKTIFFIYVVIYCIMLWFWIEMPIYIIVSDIVSWSSLFGKCEQALEQIVFFLEAILLPILVKNILEI